MFSALFCFFSQSLSYALLLAARFHDAPAILRFSLSRWIQTAFRNRGYNLW
jgi:hypothetical protein